MLVMVQVSRDGEISVYGPIDSLFDPALLEIFDKGRYDNKHCPVSCGIGKGFHYGNKKGHSCVVCEISPITSPSVILEDNFLQKMW